MKITLELLRQENANKLKHINAPKEPTKNKQKVLIFETGLPHKDDLIKIEDIPLAHKSYRSMHATCVGSLLRTINSNIELYAMHLEIKWMPIIDYCIGNNIRTINMSVVTSETDEREEALKKYTEWGGIVVCASGNSGKDDQISYPARSKYTIGVSATNARDNNSDDVDITVDSHWKAKWFMKDTATAFSGTSGAAPVVSAISTYYLDNNPNGNKYTFEEWLKKNSIDDISHFSYKYAFGTLEEDERFFIFPDDLKDGEIMSNVIRDLNKLHPYVKTLAEKLIKKCSEAGINIIVTETLRTMERQAELYAQGRTKPGSIVTNAKPGNSIHNYRLAFDIVPIVNGKAAWNRHDLFDKVGAIGESIGLTWGGHFRTITDKPHFQWTGGLKLSDLKAGKSPEAPQEKEPKQQVSEWAKEAWEKAVRKGINDGEGPKNNVTEEQLMVFFDRVGLLD